MALYKTQNGFTKEDQRIFHGFFTRQGGVSEGYFAALNCGPGSGENLNIVQQNRALVAKVAGVLPVNLLSVHQEHGNVCSAVKDTWPMDQRPKADAMITDQVGIGLGILTADCAPVLFAGNKVDGSPLIGAAHAGWKGALGGVLENTIKAMQELGGEGITACVGPCISKSSYEVSMAFVEPFLEENDESGRFFQSSTKAGHLMFDLAGYCAWRLFRAGLRSIALMDMDTYTLENEFYSYRRATHRGEDEYGRQISVVSIRNLS